MLYHQRNQCSIIFSALILALMTPVFAQVDIRIMAANTTSGNFQSYEAPGERIFQGLDPDIVLIQEFTIGSSADQSVSGTNTWVDSVFGSNFDWFREAGNEQIPNGIISRYPIIQTGEIIDSEVSNRDFPWARIDIPGDNDLWAFSVHFLTRNSSVRNSEAQILVSGINSLNIPSTDYVVIGGDFNTGSRSESAVNTLYGYLGINSSSDGTPRDRNGNSDTNRNRNNPYDWVLASSNLNDQQIATQVGSNVFNEGLVFDSRVYTPLSDVSPVQSSDSNASNMQHQAVIKDFRVSDVSADYTLNQEFADFGTQNASLSPYFNNVVMINPSTSIQITDVEFTGENANEFSLRNPSLNTTFDTTMELEFRWDPDSNDRIRRNVTATFTTNATPATFEISLTGTPSLDIVPNPGDPIDLSGYKLEQMNSTQEFFFPNGTFILPQGIIVIGRNSEQASFESFWGVTLGENVQYINSGDNMPVINGGESYALFDDEDGMVDPSSGLEFLPDFNGINSSRSYKRLTTTATIFFDEDASLATPGEYNQLTSDNEAVVITEISDALGGGNFIYEFVEIFYDEAQPSNPDVWFMY